MQRQRQAGKVQAMSYPKKISRDTILDIATTHVEAGGLQALSMRSLAAELGVAPNALYRHVASKAELEYALADRAGTLLLNALEKAAARKDPIQAVPAMAKAYIRFARQHPQLYAIKMRHCSPDGHEPDSYTRIWAFVMALATQLNTSWPPKDLAQSLWAYLHGMVELDRADLLEGHKPEVAIEVGLAIMMAGVMASPSPSR